MSKVIEHRMREGARPTKQVLGEHLYHKISLALSQYEFDPELELESRLTGMMLELPADTVMTMLTSQGVLISYICRALDALVQLFPQLGSVATAFKEQTKLSLTREDVGSLIYTSVAKLEPAMADKITGMLLELDTATLLSLLNQEDTSFPAAIEKAKRALEQSTKLRLSNGVSNSGQLKEGRSQATGSNSDGDEDNDIVRTKLGTTIYTEAMSSHPECAANITGMLLELSVTSLNDIVNDKDKLSCAIDKSYRAWHASGS